MPEFNVRLLGKFQLYWNEHHQVIIEPGKVQELFCYLLIHRDHPQPREVLAELLWSGLPGAQAKKYLRQALWQLRASLRVVERLLCSPLLIVETEWIQIHSLPEVELDVAEFEETYLCFQGRRGAELCKEEFQKLQKAAELYCGDLLEGCYQDWCIFERERLENIYLEMLDKLMEYCEPSCAYEAGRQIGAKILQIDPANERTHQRLMRLYLLEGNRTAALQQYQRCVAALERELNVGPSTRTRQLYESVCYDQPIIELTKLSPDVVRLANKLKLLDKVLSELHVLIHEDLELIESIQ